MQGIFYEAEKSGMCDEKSQNVKISEGMKKGTGLLSRISVIA